jgi:acetylornithine aminotransferase
MMKLFDVYPIFDLEIQHARGSYVFDPKGQKYLDFYGGHAVISVGHGHPYFVEAIKKQLDRIAFYSNSVINPLQEKLADQIALISGLTDCALFLCNSGAEANENAIKLSSFFNRRKKIIALKRSFHGRMSATMSASDCLKKKSAIGTAIQTDFFHADRIADILEAIHTREYACILIEKVQGIGGLDVISGDSLRSIKSLCDATDTVMVMDEVQCGCGRTGKYFAFQHDDIEPDIITMAKGIGNGFPIGGLLVNDQKIKPSYGLLGSTFGGNHLACAAAIAVTEILEQEKLLQNGSNFGLKLGASLSTFPHVKQIQGMGLMLGVEFEFPIAQLRKALVHDHFTFVGSSANPKQLRILPPLNISQTEVDWFLRALNEGISAGNYSESSKN